MQLNIFFLTMIPLLIFSGSGCKSNKASAGTATRQEAAVKPETGKAPLVISFYSTGTGAAVDKREFFKKWIADYGVKNGVKITPREKAWGREGEYDFCFFFEGLSENQVKSFKDAAKQELAGVKNVHFLENHDCRQ